MSQSNEFKSSLYRKLRRAAPPRVIQTIPANGAVGVNPAAGVTVVCNKYCMSLSFTSVPYADWYGIFIAGGKSLVQTPSPPLAPRTLYTIRVSAMDFWGRTLPGGSYEFSFTTA